MPLKPKTYEEALAQKIARDEKNRARGYIPRKLKSNASTEQTSANKGKSKSKPNITKLKKILWELCKQVVRLQAKDKNGKIFCYTCGKNVTENKSNQHTSHFVPSSICGIGLRFDLKNLRVTCYSCNVQKSGNFPAYQEHLIQDVGQEEVETLLQRRHEFTKGDTHFYQAKIDEYQILVDNLKSTNNIDV